jgi:hypothetical protein
MYYIYLSIYLSQSVSIYFIFIYCHLLSRNAVMRSSAQRALPLPDALQAWTFKSSKVGQFQYIRSIGTETGLNHVRLPTFLIYL